MAIPTTVSTASPPVPATALIIPGDGRHAGLDGIGVRRFLAFT